MANTYLTYTPSSGVTLGTKATISFWVKRSKLDSSGNFYGILSSNGGWNDGTGFAIGWREDLLVWYNLANNSGYRTYTNRQFKDTNAWYHILYKIDTTQASMQDRITLYVNGEDQGDLTSNTSISNAMPSQNASLNQFFDSGDQHQVGRGGSAGSTYFDGSLSHFHYVDGSALAPTVFGSTDSTTGEWKINTSPSYTVGNNGFFILKDGNSVTDQSANSNNFTVSGGTLTKTEDCPSNVFATLNPLWRSRWVNDSTFEHGNNTLDNTSSGGGYGFSTLGMTSGKYYFEAKCTEVARIAVGVGDANFVQGKDNTWYNFNPSNAIGIIYDGGLYYNNTSNSAYHGSAIQTNDIVQVALDMDNYRMWFGINGTWLNSATQTQIENGTATYDVTTKIGTQNVINNGEPMHFFVADISGSGVGSASVNFGNGYFGTTAVSSAGSNASGNGIFEYDVPTGYTALSTKGLNL